MGPCKFKDLLKGPSDLLSDDFTSKKSVKTKFVAPIAGGITFTSEDEVKTSDALVLKSIAGKLSGKWKHKASGVSVDKLELKGTDVKLEVSYPVAGFKTKVKTAVESGSIGATSAECEKGFGVGTFFGALSSKKVDLSLNTSLAKLFSFGGAISCALDTYKLKAYDVGGSYKSGPLMLGVVSGSMFKECTVAATYAASPTLTLALKATSDFNKKNDVTAGGALTLSKTLSAKAKFGKDSIEAVASNKLAAGVKVDIGATLPYADPVGAAKFGCLFTLG